MNQIWDGKNPDYDNSDIWANYATGPGSSVTWNSTNGIYDMIAGTGGQAIHRSRYAMYYQSGKSPLVFMSFVGFGGTGGTKRLGYYTNYFVSGAYNVLDGLVLENVDGEVSFNIYSKTTTPSESFPQSSWSSEYFDPSLIDWSAMHIMAIDFEWLSAGRVRFGLVIDGTIKWFVEANHANNPAFSQPYMLSPNHFITSELVGGTGTVTLGAICSSYGVEGSATNALGRNFAITNPNGTVTTLVKNVRYAVLGYRLKKGESLSGIIKIRDFFSASQDTSTVYAVSVVLNPTLSIPGVFGDFSDPDVPVQYSTPNTSITATGGHEFTIGIGSGSNSFNIPSSDNMYHPGYTFDDAASYGVNADEVWFCVTPLSGNITSPNKVFISANLFLESQ